MDDLWRMAFMLDAREGDLGALEHDLARAAEDIRGLAGDADLRIGIADRSESLLSTKSAFDVQAWRTVDGAVELSVAASRAGDLPEVCRKMRDVLGPIANPSSVEVMAGPVFPMVSPRDGGAFLSLAFKRYPGSTSEEFRNWWRHQHSGLAISIIGPLMLAYDQVHVDPAVTQAVARAYGVAPVLYDAYDNLTYVDREHFLASISDAEGNARILADEVRRIDNGSRRYALMRKIG